MRLPAHCAARRGFTLVELVTAASLMTVLMLGVVEVFGIITTTAGEAQGIHFAQRQIRATFDRLHDDIRGMTREGYFRIDKGSYQETVGRNGTVTIQYTPQSAGSGRTATSRYGCDSLAFVTVGPCRSQLQSGTSASEASCAEVVYTNYVKSDSQPLRVNGKDVDSRRGILARGSWILGGDVGQAAADPYLDDRSSYSFLCELFRNENDSQSTVGTGTSETLTQEAAISRCQDYLKIWPWLEQGGSSSFSEHPETLNRVMACCVSEFFVEVLTPDAVGTRTGSLFDNDSDRTYTWSKDYATDEEPKTWPAAIRVTIAVHDPADTGTRQPGNDRFEGFAMQETFWFGDP